MHTDFQVCFLSLGDFLQEFNASFALVSQLEDREETVCVREDGGLP